MVFSSGKSNDMVDAACSVSCFGIQNYRENCKLLQNSEYCNVCVYMHLFSLGFRDFF